MSKVNIVFSGQGSQFVGMGKDFYDADETTKQLFQQANDILGYSISDICFEGPDDRLNQTQYTQVAIFIHSACIFEQLKSRSFDIHSFAGHSLGEITAYYAAGVLDFESALKIVIKRGELMAEAAQKTAGKMAAIIGLSEHDVTSVCENIDGVAIANYNSPVQFVISGESAQVETAMAALNEKGAKRIIELPVSGAFHSPLMASAVSPFQDYLRQFSFNDAATPIILNRIARPETNASELQKNLSLQIESPVRFIEIVHFLSKSSTQFIEVGPGKVLSGLIKKINREYSVQPTSTLDGVEKILTVEV
tara:strand:- start:1518 stop:2438 length:921 start_codon:yes stop_codon:yes gene_type:complete